MHILITNDDGIDAPGLHALAAAARDMGRISVLAPHRNWSMSGHARRMNQDLHIWDHPLPDGTMARACDGTPSDCVSLAIHGMLDEPIDMVFSGINPHANLGSDVTYSGTVTAAIEAVVYGVAGFAISLNGSNQPEPLDYKTAAVAAVELIRQIPPSLYKGRVHSINIPYMDRASMHGVAITRLGVRTYNQTLIRQGEVEGRERVMMTSDTPGGEFIPGTDVWALEQGLISITPIQLDMTDAGRMAQLKALDLSLST